MAGSGNNQLFQQAAAGVTKLVGVSVFSRLITFTLNQLLVRATTPEVFGFAAIQLELVLGTVLFLSREPIRLAVLRVPEPSQHMQRIRRLGYIPFFASCVFVVAIAAYFVAKPAVSVDNRIAYGLYCLAAVIESLSEPWFNMNQVLLHTTPRVNAEAAGVLVKSVVTYVAVGVMAYNAVGFGLAQVAYGITYSAVMVLSSHSVGISATLQKRSGKPDTVPNREPEPANSSKQAWSMDVGNIRTFARQSVLKYLLQEADKIALTWWATQFNQGVYALVNNYGSLLVRTVFLSVEDNARVLFARLTVVPTGSRLSKSQSQAVLQVFVTMMRIMVAVGLLFATFGVNYSRALLLLLPGKSWYSEDAVFTLATYCIYVMVMAINGVTEALLYVVVDDKSMKTVNAGLVAGFVVFAASIHPLMSALGTAGLVGASILGMTVRVLVAFHLLSKWFGERMGTTVRPLLMIWPQSSAMLVFLLAFGVTTLSAVWYASSALDLKALSMHVSIGAVCFAGVVALLWVQERRNISQLRELSRNGPMKSD